MSGRSGAMLELASINIERSRHLDRVGPFLAAQAPDIACLQEVAEDDLDVLADHVGAVGRLYVPMCRVPEHGRLRPSGLAILARHPFVHTEIITYAGGGSGGDVIDRRSEEARFASMRYALAVVVLRLGDTDVTLATTHFPWTDNARTSDFQHAACDTLLSLAGSRPLVLTGDFNAPRGKEVFARLAAQWQDHVPAHYTSSIDPELHRAPHLELMVDGLFSTPDYDVGDVVLHTGVSDHRAITATIAPRAVG